MNHVFRGNIFFWNLQLHLLALHVLDILRNFPKQVKDERWSRKRYDAWKSLVRLFCFRGERAQLCFERKRLRIVLAENWRGLEKGKRIESIERTWTFLRVSCNKVDDTWISSWNWNATNAVTFRRVFDQKFQTGRSEHFRAECQNPLLPQEKFCKLIRRVSPFVFYRFIRIEEIWFFFGINFYFCDSRNIIETSR